MIKIESLPRILVHQNCDIEILINYLEFRNYKTIIADPDNLIDDLKKGDFDLCILDSYEYADKKQVFKPVRILRDIAPNVPIVFISDKNDYDFIIQAFKAGIDDYVLRPYNMEELICRITAVLRRCGIKTRRIESTYKLGDYTFDTEKSVLLYENAELRMSKIPSKMLAILCAYKNEVLPINVLIEYVWNSKPTYHIKRSLDVHLFSLRKLLNKDESIKIITESGKKGYMLKVYE